jgi:hypothetical protein
MQFLWTEANSPPLSPTFESTSTTQHPKWGWLIYPLPFSASETHPKCPNSNESAEEFPYLFPTRGTSTPIL